MKKAYASPIISPYFPNRDMAFPVVAAPLAVLSAATSAAAVAGAAAGAVVAAKVLGDDVNRYKMKKLQQIKGYI